MLARSSEKWHQRKTVIEFAPSVIASIYLVNDERARWQTPKEVREPPRQDHGVVRSFFLLHLGGVHSSDIGCGGVAKVSKDYREMIIELLASEPGSPRLATPQ